MMNELIAKVDAFVQDKITREDFENWFYDLAYDVECNKDVVVIELTHEIEALLAECSAAQWPVQSLKEELDSAVVRYKPLPLQRRAG